MQDFNNIDQNEAPKIIVGGLDSLLSNQNTPEVPSLPENTSITLNQPSPVEEVIVEPIQSVAPAIEVKAEASVSKELVIEEPVAETIESHLEAESFIAKKEGKIEEVVNVLLTEMHKLVGDNAKQAANTENIKNILEKVAIDPYNINVAVKSSSDPLATQAQLSTIQQLNASSYFPIIALKSGYRANMGALNNNEKIMVRNFRGTIYDQTNALLRLIHGKVIDTSVGKIAYDSFLNITAEEDYETLLYGVYHATFPEPTEYVIQCPHCGTENRLKIRPNNLVEVIDKDRASNYVQEVLQGYSRGKEFLENSLVAKSNRIVLPDSKMVIELITPTLAQMLANLRLIENTKNIEMELVSTTKHISKIFVPDIQSFQMGHAKFGEINERQMFLGIINKLSSNDLKELRRGIAERVMRFSVHYQIPKFTCAGDSCRKVVANSRIDIMRLIFFAIAGEME